MDAGAENAVESRNEPKAHRWWNAAAEFLGCAALAFVLSLTYRTIYASLKWFVYEAGMATAMALFAYLPLLLIALIVARAKGKNWWSAHRFAVFGALLWVLLASYGSYVALKSGA